MPAWSETSIAKCNLAHGRDNSSQNSLVPHCRTIREGYGINDVGSGEVTNLLMVSSFER